MLPRITQQSHSAAPRRESQIEPWLAMCHRQACVASGTERRCSVDVKTTRELRISATKHDARGWMSENYPFLQRREKCFLLTSPFIEPGANRCALCHWECFRILRRGAFSASRVRPGCPSRNADAGMVSGAPAFVLCHRGGFSCYRHLPDFRQGSTPRGSVAGTLDPSSYSSTLRAHDDCAAFPNWERAQSPGGHVIVERSGVVFCWSTR